MDRSAAYEEEVVADSEEEVSFLPTSPQPAPINPVDTSSIQAPALHSMSDTNNLPTTHSNISHFSDPPPNKILGSSISSFTPLNNNASSSIAKTSDSTSPSISRPTGRPKPRPAYKGAKGATSSSILDPSSSSKVPSPIQANSSNLAADSNPFPNVQMAASTSKTFEFDVYPTHMNIAERAKMRSRNTKSTIPPMPTPSLAIITPPMKKQRRTKSTPVPSPRVIELTSDEDELTLRPQKPHKVKTKPKPKPVKSNQISHPSPPPAHPDSTSQATIPTPTSSIPIPIPLTSQLPPSDPPASTFTEYEHPPIAVLPNLDSSFDLDLDAGPDIPSSSPLFSPPIITKKRKRPGVRDDFSWDVSGVGGGAMDIDTQGMPPPALPLPLPPPTFFASSSAPDAGPSTVEIDVIDPTPVPPVIAIGGPTAAKKMPKPKATPKKRKKEREIAADGDGQDGGKTKAKPRVKKGKGKETTTGQVEVTVDAPVAKSKAKGKGKEKEKEVFKSREFIDDEEEEDVRDELIGGKLGGSVKGSAASPSTGRPKSHSVSSLSSVPDSEPGEMVEEVRKRKVVAGGWDGDEDEIANSSKKKQKKTGKQTERGGGGGKGTRKGKMVILSDEEDDGGGEAVVEEIKEAKSKTKEVEKDKDKDKGATKDKGKKGKKATPDADDHEGGTAEVESEDKGVGNVTKENHRPKTNTKVDTSTGSVKESLFPSISSRYTIAPRTKSTPMSELIRRVNSLPGSPFASTPRSRPSSSSATPGTATAYSPYLKSSRTFLSRIAPLHPNRRTPPPPLPPPPPPKKTKKEKEREERWEEELVESVGGVTEWACLTDAERREMRRAKREMEMGGWED